MDVRKKALMFGSIFILVSILIKKNTVMLGGGGGRGGGEGEGQENGGRAWVNLMGYG